MASSTDGHSSTTEMLASQAGQIDATSLTGYAVGHRVDPSIHGTMSKTDDGAAIYTLGNQPGTIIRGNHIHDCKNPTSTRGWSSGVYFDEGSGFIESTGNVVYRVPGAVTRNNLQQDRLATCKEHDNLFDCDPEEAAPVAEKAGLEAKYRDLLEKP